MTASERAPTQFSIFGGTERPKVDNARTMPAQGYAARPGSGPQGETCGSCAHCCKRERTRVYYKCELIMAGWTASRTTDVLVSSPACSYWAAGEPRTTTVSKLRGA